MTSLPAPLILESPKLGQVPYGAGDVIHFADGIPGFEELRSFLLVNRQECAPFLFLTSLEDPEVALPLLPLSAAAGEAAPLIAAAAVDLARWEPGPLVAAYAVVAISHEARDVWVNLRAPVVMDLGARRGRQIILADDTLPVAGRLGA
jgi:flagellar assembly factor FliW